MAEEEKLKNQSIKPEMTKNIISDQLSATASKGGVSLLIQSSPGCVNTKGTTLCVLPHPVSLSAAMVLVAPLHATVKVLKLSMITKLWSIVRNCKGFELMMSVFVKAYKHTGHKSNNTNVYSQYDEGSLFFSTFRIILIEEENAQECTNNQLSSYAAIYL